MEEVKNCKGSFGNVENKNDLNSSFFTLNDKASHDFSHNVILQKSNLFQKCLSELNQELKTYKQENEMLRLQRHKFKEQHKKLKELSEKLQAELSMLQDEKKQLTHEKCTYKNKIKEAYEKVLKKCIEKNKQDSHKIYLMQDEKEKLKDEFLQKESEWSVVNGRQKSQIRILQIENSKLKQELKESQEKNQKKKSSSSTNIKGVQQTNIAMGKQILDLKNEQTPQMAPRADVNCVTVHETNGEELKRKNHLITAESIVKKRNLYESLLRDAVKDLSNPQTEKKSAGDHMNKEKNDNKQGVKEIKHSDGRMEYHYPNGNIKIIFPNECGTKMMYYNGDIQEIDNNEMTKYFYASSKTLHTTMPDGLEIFEFPE